MEVFSTGGCHTVAVVDTLKHCEDLERIMQKVVARCSSCCMSLNTLCLLLLLLHGADHIVAVALHAGGYEELQHHRPSGHQDDITECW